MPIQKTKVKSAVPNKVNPAKKPEIKKPTVIVETKRTDKCSCGDACDCGKSKSICSLFINVLVMLLVVANLVFLVLNYLHSARKVEELKVGGAKNMPKVEKLYQSESYVDARRQEMMQVLENIK